MSDAGNSTMTGITENSHDLAKKLGEHLSNRQWTCALAESCTGGLIGHLITAIPGSSDYFAGGIVAYSNEAKSRFLDVSPETLREFGAVSPETATRMATGARAGFGADLGIASTGIAGPGGGTDRKPVGLVYIAVETPEQSIVRELRLLGDREQNIQDSATAALRLALLVTAGSNQSGREH